MDSRLWDKRTLAQCVLSALVAVGVAVSVSAARGELGTSAQPPTASVSTGHTCAVSVAEGK